jgi:hypothetical protein
MLSLCTISFSLVLCANEIKRKLSIVAVKFYRTEPFALLRSLPSDHRPVLYINSYYCYNFVILGSFKLYNLCLSISTHYCRNLACIIVELTHNNLTICVKLTTLLLSHSALLYVNKV